MQLKDKIIIENAVLENAPDILKLQHLCYQSEAALINDFTIPPLTQTLEELQAEFKTGLVLKGTCNNRIIGSVRSETEDTVCFINKLIVHPDFQNMGIGTLLMQTMESKHNNATEFRLFTGSKSIKNIRFYEKLGYSRFRETKISDKLTFVYLRKLL